MADSSTLDALQALHQEILSLHEGRIEGVEVLENEYLVQIFEQELARVWQHPPQSEASRNMVKTGRPSSASKMAMADEGQGKISMNGEEFSINEEFQQHALTLSEELSLDEAEAARCLLEALPDIAVLGRSLLECGIIRYHQQRKYVLDILRLLMDMEQLDDQLEDSALLDALKTYIEESLFHRGGRLADRCLGAMATIKSWLSSIADKLAAAQTLGQRISASAELETIEYSRLSLLQQHEALGVVLCRAIEQRQAEVQDFKTLLESFRKADRYDILLGTSSPCNFRQKLTPTSPFHTGCRRIYIPIWLNRRWS